MLNLFGQGIHPDAERIRAGAVRRGAPVPQAFARPGSGRGSRCSRAGGVADRLGERYSAWNQVHGLPADCPIPAEERTRIRTDVAREMFAEQHDREPVHQRELSGFVAQVSRPDSSAVAGFDLTFSPVKSVSTLWAVAPREVARADRGGARRRGRRRRWSGWNGGRVHQGRRRAGSRRSTSAAWSSPRVHPPRLPGR